MFILGIGAAVVITGWEGMKQGDWSALAMFGLCFLHAAIGFADDYVKVKKKGNQFSALKRFCCSLLSP